MTNAIDKHPFKSKENLMLFILHLSDLKNVTQVKFEFKLFHTESWAELPSPPLNINFSQKQI